jgi:hypothetical protein
MIFRRTITLPWDDLDIQACADDGEPAWNTLIITGPVKRRGVHGQVSLEWTVTVQCQPSPDLENVSPGLVG